VAEYPKCDFCSAPFPAWVHPSADFSIPHLGWVSADGAWAACDVCHEMIMAEAQVRLRDRAVRTFAQRHGPLPKAAINEMRSKITTMHAGFWQNRNGEPFRDEHVKDAQHRQEGLREE
jgi:hypothetical protein